MISNISADGAWKLCVDIQTLLPQLHQVHDVMHCIIISNKSGASQNCNRLLPLEIFLRLSPGKNETNLDLAVQLVLKNIYTYIYTFLEQKKRNFHSNKSFQQTFLSNRIWSWILVNKVHLTRRSFICFWNTLDSFYTPKLKGSRDRSVIQGWIIHSKSIL